MALHTKTKINHVRFISSLSIWLSLKYNILTNVHFMSEAYTWSDICRYIFETEEHFEKYLTENVYSCRLTLFCKKMQWGKLNKTLTCPLGK